MTFSLRKCRGCSPTQLLSTSGGYFIIRTLMITTGALTDLIALEQNFKNLCSRHTTIGKILRVLLISFMLQKQLQCVSFNRTFLIQLIFVLLFSSWAII